jgi:hypothetical protein
MGEIYQERAPDNDSDLARSEIRGRSIVAKNMLADFIPIQIIAKYTDFSEEELLVMSLETPVDDIRYEYTKRKSRIPFKNPKKFLEKTNGEWW